jgi:exopolyphosphatase/guanosine-5'-triphosphate,3'-diphosphate pyrophosphatase
MRQVGFDMAFGSSGTITNLAEITAKRVAPGMASVRNYLLRYTDLTETISLLCGLSVEERRNVPGINPDRVDIIMGGAAILDGVMVEAGADSIRISDRALREGMVIDHLFQEDVVKEHYLNTSVRERSILQLGRSCHFEEAHARKVSEIACSIFRQLVGLRLHNYGEKEEELLTYVCFCHDVGIFLSYVDHHKHSYYLVRNWNLLGFDDEEVETIASSVLCHRKMSPKRANPGKLTPATRRLVEVLSAIVRVADALDRTQMGLVRDVICRRNSSGKRLTLEIHASEDCPLEMWALESKKSLFEKVFELGLIIERVIGGRDSG